MPKNTHTEPLYTNLATFDYQLLVDRLLGDKEITQLILAEFMKNTGPKIMDLPTHVERHGISSLLRHTHAIKGAAGNISALALHRMAIDLEEAGRRENTAAIHNLITLIQTHYETELRTILERQLAS